MKEADAYFKLNYPWPNGRTEPDYFFFVLEQFLSKDIKDPEVRKLREQEVSKVKEYFKVQRQKVEKSCR